jgi:hypothetical protein
MPMNNARLTRITPLSPVASTADSFSACTISQVPDHELFANGGLHRR